MIDRERGRMCGVLATRFGLDASEEHEEDRAGLASLRGEDMLDQCRTKSSPGATLGYRRSVDTGGGDEGASAGEPHRLLRTESSERTRAMLHREDGEI